MKRKHPELPDRYDAFLQELKERIRSAQVRAALSVNRELVLLYWGIGRDILDRQKSEGWGAKVVDRLAHDLLQAFPGMTGFGARNLKYMRAFAEAYPDQQFVQQVVAQLPWGHNVRILEMVKAPAQREWYIRQAVESGWTRNVLVHQIEGDLHRRQGRAVTNFQRTLPAPQSELAQELLKDRMQRNFDPMRQQVEQWRAQQLAGELARLTIYRAFIEGELEAPKHLARRVHDLYFNPQHEEFSPRTMWSLSNAFTSALQGTGSHSTI
jgi:predicted nuclease of restriction endonuclease-like (RecB) superfamily